MDINMEKSIILLLMVKILLVEELIWLHLEKLLLKQQETSLKKILMQQI